MPATAGEAATASSPALGLFRPEARRCAEAARSSYGDVEPIFIDRWGVEAE